MPTIEQRLNIAQTIALRRVRQMEVMIKERLRETPAHQYAEISKYKMMLRGIREDLVKLGVQ